MRICECSWKGNGKHHSAGQHCTHEAVYLVEVFGEFPGRFHACETHTQQARKELEAKNVPVRATVIVSDEELRLARQRETATK